MPGTIGAVLCDSAGDVETFGRCVPDRVYSAWQVAGKTPVVGLVELYAAAVALTRWKERCLRRRAMAFIDNWTALGVLTKGSSSQPSSRYLLMLLEDPSDFVISLVWFARVPSQSKHQSDK